MSTEWDADHDHDHDHDYDTEPESSAVTDPDPEPEPEQATAVEATAEALTREDVLAARVRLLTETVGALRAAQGPQADGESRALGYVVGSACRALRRLLRALGQWEPDGAGG